MFIKHKDTEVSLKDDTALKVCGILCGTVAILGLLTTTTFICCKKEIIPIADIVSNK